MYLNISFLFFSSLFAGLAVLLIPKPDINKFKSVLSFSGAYLFSITVIHLLPELFHESRQPGIIGMYVLAGFFFQLILEYFTSGVEHGHIHVHAENASKIPYTMLLSMGIHSFLDGSLLVHPGHDHSKASSLLFGMILHKIPESFALMSVLYLSLSRKPLAILLLVLFSFASPLGLLLSHSFYISYQATEIFIVLFALIAGNFLYISTTIFFETSPNHKFKANKLVVSLLGAFFAIIMEYMINQ